MFSSILALISAIAIGGADFLGGKAARSTPATGLVAVVQAIEFALLGIIVMIFGADPQTSDWLLGAVSGVAGSLAFVLFLMALARGPMSLVSPFAALIGVSTPVITGVVLGERPATIAWLGIALGIAAIGMTSLPTSEEDPVESARGTTLLMAGVAGIGFALFVIGLDATTSASGLVPLLAARLTGVSILALIVLVRKERWLEREARPVALGVGVLETVAVATLITALHGGSLVLMTVLSSMYPVVTVLLAVTILEERIDRVHKIGVALALLAVGLIATA